MQPGDNDPSSTESGTDAQAPAAETSPWQYSQESETTTTQPHPNNLPPVSWTASEFIDNEKNASWFLGLTGATVLASAVIYLITHDVITPIVIAIAAVLFGITAKRKPRTLEYLLDHAGVTIGGKPYSYSLFKSFSMMEEGAFTSIQLMPLKRFMPPISLYYPPESEERIITTLGSYLPHEERSHDEIDHLMRKIRF